MKKLFTFIGALAMMLCFSVAAFAVPPEKAQPKQTIIYAESVKTTVQLGTKTETTYSPPIEVSRTVKRGVSVKYRRTDYKFTFKNTIFYPPENIGLN